MSRASTLRDAIVTELQTLLGSSYTVEKFTIARYKREDLASGPRVIVRVGGRDAQLQQGYDPTSVMIHVGVVGLGPDMTEQASGTTYVAAETSQCDTYDGIIETLLGYWMRGGGMSGSPNGENGHWPTAITFPYMQFDHEMLNERGIYLSLFQVTYRDSEDE